MEMLHIDGQEEEQINLDAYLHDKNDVMEMLHDDGQEEEQWLSKKRFENFCIMMPIYLCFWVSGEMIITTSTLR
jgi:hypothetical protein